MRNTKSTGDRWCAEIPATWRFVPLRRLGVVVGGGTPTPDPENWNGDVPFVTPPDLRPVTGGAVEATDRSVTRRGAERGSTVVPAGTVLVSIRAPIGYVARTVAEAAFNQGCRALVPDRGNAHDRYLVYALVAASQELDAQGRGTTFMELSASQFGSVRVPLPPLDEQRRIADFLDVETERIDRLVAKQTALIETLRERRDAVWAESVERLRSCPPTQLRRVVDSLVDGPFGSGLTSAHYSDAGVRVIRLGNIGINEFKFADEAYVPAEYGATLLAHEAMAGDVVIAGLGDDRMPLGRAAVVPELGAAIVKADCYRARPNSLVTAEYLAWVLSSPQLRSELRLMARGSTRERLNTAVVQTAMIPLPPLASQRSAVAVFDAQTAKIDGLIAKAERFIEFARERRSALITAAVTGQIDVREAA